MLEHFVSEGSEALAEATEEAVGASSLQTYEVRLNGDSNSLIQWGAALPLARGLPRQYLRSVPTQPIPWFCACFWTSWAVNNAFLYFKSCKCDVHIFRLVISLSLQGSLVKKHWEQFFFKLETGMASPAVINLLELDTTNLELDTTNRY